MATKRRAIGVALGWILAIGIGAGAVAVQVDSSTTTTTTTTSTSSSSTSSSSTTTTTPPAGGPETCGYYRNAEQCWQDTTGVLNTLTSNPYDIWTKAQVEGGFTTAVDSEGHHPSDQLQRITGNVTINTSGTAGAYTQYHDKYIDGGCITVDAEYVHIYNVFVRNGGTCNALSGSGSQGSFTGGAASFTTCMSVSQYGCTLRHYLHLDNVESDAGDQPSTATTYGLRGWGWTVYGSNFHGGQTPIGPYISNLSLSYSYIHDSNCGGTIGTHQDIIWAQGQTKLGVTHSYLSHNHWNYTGPLGGPWSCQGTSNTAAILMNVGATYIYLADTYISSRSNLGIEAGGSKVVASNIHFDYYNNVCDDTTGGDRCYSGAPTSNSDYQTGAWTPTFDQYGLPNMSNSYCTNLFHTSVTGTDVKYAC